MEEFLPVVISAPSNGRRVLRDVEIAGTLLRGPRTGEPGDYVICNLGGANRDPSVFKYPEQTDIARMPTRPLSCAAGVLRSRGQHLTRLNRRVAIEAFITRIENFTLAAGFVSSYLCGITRRLRTVPLPWRSTSFNEAIRSCSVARCA